VYLIGGLFYAAHTRTDDDDGYGYARMIDTSYFVPDVIHLSPFVASDHSILMFDCSLSVVHSSGTDKFSLEKGTYEDFRFFLRRNWDLEL
jgi:hypothetical protein